ncbi:hypothetical protein Cob_v006514 [Colletotrichum orbiculare MAFF 240422]|uniref:Uncharacterized protein n=1 Tax=Colletotrichum orbiculare (strain 104-T / ATCC 96160 / CBS 514.97 / LARS 414 / MAFF 240422) TaxID=1213857 RepID=N4V9A5_COLOR|nr:hypothetical protein Cob_v006514 [Colletotrichum orbiculare MAFF 240422]
MGLITGLVSTLVHVAAGRNPYNHNHNPATSTSTTSSAHDAVTCTDGPGGQPCGICAVALPFGKGRQQKRERRAVRHAAKAQRFSGGRYPAYIAGGRHNAALQYGGVEQHQCGPGGYQPAGMQCGAGPQFGGETEGSCLHGRQGVVAEMSTAQQEGIEMRRRNSTGMEDAPPAYEEGESSRTAGRRSVEVLGEGDEKQRI